MDIFLHWLINVGSLLAGLFWFFMVLDCLTNKALNGGYKIGWIILILCTQAWGAAIYLFLGRSYLLPKLVKYVRKLYKKAHAQQAQLPYTPGRASVPHAYLSYQQGYQAQNSALFAADDADPQYYDPQFEQPLASYPVMRLPMQR